MCRFFRGRCNFAVSDKWQSEGVENDTKSQTSQNRKLSSSSLWCLSKHRNMMTFWIATLITAKRNGEWLIWETLCVVEGADCSVSWPWKPLILCNQPLVKSNLLYNNTCFIVVVLFLRRMGVCRIVCKNCGRILRLFLCDFAFRYLILHAFLRGWFFCNF